MKDEPKRNLYSCITFKVRHFAVLNETNRSNRRQSELFALYSSFLNKITKFNNIAVIFVNSLFFPDTFAALPDDCNAFN